MRRTELLKEVMHELQKVSVGEEVSTVELLMRVHKNKGFIIDCDSLYLMWLNEQVIEKAENYGVIIDTSIHDDEDIGMPYDIGFLVKEKRNECNKY